jgi:osmotically-inducible protein OsmY
MKVAAHTSTDRTIHAAVEAELEWTPDVDAAGIGVAVDDGVVTLSGEVEFYAQRAAAKRAALRVRDVTAVVNDISVHPASPSSVSEADIGKAVDFALRSAVNVPDSVKAEIEGHDVTLRGEVSRDFQRRAAKRAVEHLRGVTSVHNWIKLSPRPSAPDTQARIEDAILRNAQLDASAIDVVVAGDRVTLSGQVRSWAERRQADLAAWSSPHVSEVYNHIIVRSA